VNGVGPQGEPDNAPDPLDELPDSIGPDLLCLEEVWQKVSDRDHNVGVPDLTVRQCAISLPPMPPDPEELDLPDIDFEELRQQRFFSFAAVTAEVFNEGPGDAGEFDVRFTVAMADWDEATDRFEIVGNPVIRQRTLSSLRAHWHHDMWEPLLPVQRVLERLYIAVVEVNPMTPDRPLGKVVENNYANNRCGQTCFDHPGSKRPLEPRSIDEVLEPLSGQESWWVPPRRS
jgi:hypothetical protein